MNPAPTICSEPDCPGIVRNGNRCQAHRGTGHNRRGSSRAWRKLREQVLARDRWTCRYCGQPATEVDHVTPRAAGGPDSAANLAASCRACNLTKGATPGWRKPPGDPATADIPQPLSMVYGSGCGPSRAA